jgi:hypothetical protein
MKNEYAVYHALRLHALGNPIAHIEQYLVMIASYAERREIIATLDTEPQLLAA